MAWFLTDNTTAKQNITFIYIYIYTCPHIIGYSKYILQAQCKSLIWMTDMTLNAAVFVIKWLANLVDTYLLKCYSWTAIIFQTFSHDVQKDSNLRYQRVPQCSSMLSTLPVDNMIMSYPTLSCLIPIYPIPSHHITSHPIPSHQIINHDVFFCKVCMCNRI